MKKVLIIIVILIVLILGYVFSIPCDVAQNNKFLQYVYKIKCESKQTVINENVNVPEVANQNNQNTSTNNLNQNIENPNAQSKIKKISNSKILNYTITPNNEIIVVDDSGNIIKITDKEEFIYQNINPIIPIEILFSDDGSKIVFIFKNLISIFDIKTQNWKQLPQSASNAIAISKNNKIAYFQKENNTNSIYLLDINKKDSTPIKLMQINMLNSKLIWKDDSNLFITSYPSSLNVGYVWLLNIKDKTLKLVYELPGLYFDWNEKLNQGFLFYSNESQLKRGGFFSLVNKDLKSQKFSFLTLPPKCSLNQKIDSQNSTSTNKSTQSVINYVFCAVPTKQQSLQEKLVIDDYLTFKLYTEDEFYQINVDEGLINKIQIPNNQFFDAINLKNINNKLFFINRFDNNLYEINL